MFYGTEYQYLGFATQNFFEYNFYDLYDGEFDRFIHEDEFRVLFSTRCILLYLKYLKQDYIVKYGNMAITDMNEFFQRQHTQPTEAEIASRDEAKASCEEALRDYFRLLEGETRTHYECVMAHTLPLIRYVDHHSVHMTESGSDLYVLWSIIAKMGHGRVEPLEFAPWSRADMDNETRRIMGLGPLVVPERAQMSGESHQDEAVFWDPGFLDPGN